MYWDSNNQYQQSSANSNDTSRQTYSDFSVPANQTQAYPQRDTQPTPVERIRLDEASQHELAERRSMVEGIRVMTHYIAGPTGMRVDLLHDHAYSKAKAGVIKETARKVRDGVI